MKSWTILDDRRQLISPLGTCIQLDKDAVAAVDFGKIAVVLLSYENGVEQIVNSANVVAYNENGALLWQMAAGHRQQQNVFTGISKADASTVILSDWVGFVRHVNIETGDIEQTEEVR